MHLIPRAAAPLNSSSAAACLPLWHPFLYPVLRYFVPPAVTDLGGDEVIAAKLGEMKPNSGKIFRFGRRRNWANRSRAPNSPWLFCGSWTAIMRELPPASFGGGG